ncbi:helix-hairpin-helix domain-containing protein [Longibacter sp.]|uniref:helix-hairpin-helix domain-containing protein n=1 Tax=Longibacter sp. TaxID=2045415 RepID=UPI003EB6B341
MGMNSDRLRHLKDEMEELRAAHRKRIQELRDEVRRSTEGLADELSRFRATLEKTTKEDRRHRSERIAQIRAEVKEISADVAVQLESFRESMAAEAERARAERPNVMRETRAFVNNVRRAVVDLTAGFADERRRRYGEDARQRSEFLDGVRASVSELLAGYRAERLQREQARAEAVAIPGRAPFPGRARASAPAAEVPRDDAGAGSKSAGAGELSRVAAPPDDTTRDDATPDEGGSRLAAVMDQARQESAEPSDPAEATGDEDGIDNLAVIQGIGPKMAFRLREQGVHTFDDLAGATADEIRELMGGLPSFADVDAWIEQAEERAST